MHLQITGDLNHHDMFRGSKGMSETVKMYLLNQRQPSDNKNTRYSVSLVNVHGNLGSTAFTACRRFGSTEFFRTLCLMCQLSITTFLNYWLQMSGDFES